MIFFGSPVSTTIPMCEKLQLSYPFVTSSMASHNGEESRS